MEKYRLFDVLRATFCRFFAAVGLSAMLFVAAESFSEVPKYIEKAVRLLCFGGFF